MSAAKILRFYPHARGWWYCGPDGAPPLPVDVTEHALTAMRIVLMHPEQPISEDHLRDVLADRAPGATRPGQRAPVNWRQNAIEIVTRLRPLPEGCAENPLAGELRAIERRAGCFCYLPAASRWAIRFEG